MWRVILVETVTGRTSRVLDVGEGSWDIELNKIESGSVTVKKTALDGLARDWFSPWQAGLLFAYESPTGLVPWCGGPITGWPAESKHELQFDWKGIREILTRRHLEKDYAFKGLSLGSIAWEVVQAAQDKPGGGLPIVHGSPYEAYTPGHQRTYEWWNLANNIADKRLTELSEVINGPDMMFRPRWADESQNSVVWEFVHGTRVDPGLYQEWVPDWDTTVDASDVESFDMTSDALDIAMRVWGTGAGEGAGTVITKAEDLTLVRDFFPFLESIISDTDQAKAEPIRQKCLAALSGSQKMTDQLGMTVRADSKKNPLGSWFVGDDCRITTGDEWLSVPAGTRTMRILKASGDLTNSVNLDLQEGQWATGTDI